MTNLTQLTKEQVLDGLVELISTSGDFSLECNENGWFTSYMSPNGKRTGEQTLLEHGVLGALAGSVERFNKGDYADE